MTDQENDLLKEVVKKLEQKKISGFAKNITLIIIGVIMTFGVLGSFSFMNFNMNDYVLFLGKFALLFSPLILSIGASKAIEKAKEEKNE